MVKRIVVSGGAGYIGSHITLMLLERDFEVLVVDDFSNSSPKSLDRLQRLSNKKPALLEVDMSLETSEQKMITAFDSFGAEAAIHLAGLKAVGESVSQPLRYFRTNLNSTFNLLSALEAVGARRLVFSSSATVYGSPEQCPVTETAKNDATNPYGRTKLFIEQILKDWYAANNEWQMLNLRYFNPVGAHPSGQIGEDPKGIPNNLFPYIAKVAVGNLDELSVFGDDYDTPDGTGVRDYIHVMDLAEGHIAGLNHLSQLDSGSIQDINLGTGIGYSVLDIVKAFGKAADREIPYKIVDRRSGDVAELFAKPNLAKDLLGWEAKLGLEDMCADHWRWQSQNPNGYEDE